jgi:hypothetical protein
MTAPEAPESHASPLESVQHETQEASGNTQYVEPQPVTQDDDKLWMTFWVMAGKGEIRSTFDVPVKDIRNSSEKLRTNPVDVCEVTDVEPATVSRYINCISPTLKTSLLGYDFDLSQETDEVNE